MIVHVGIVVVNLHHNRFALADAAKDSSARLLMLESKRFTTAEETEIWL